MGLILSLPISGMGPVDCRFWRGEEKGEYMVRSGYRLAKGCEMRELESGWPGLWNLNLPPKVKCFFWTLCTMRLPTKDALNVK